MFSFILLVLFSCTTYINCVEVCDDFKYYVKPDDKHCHDDPNGERNLTEILRNGPSFVDEYNIFTEDGYQILVVNAYGENKKNGPVLLGHSAFFTSLAFANRGSKSIVHYLIKEGYDVWIVNFRGCPYSRGHKTLKSSEEKYWQFSIQEIAEYDLSSAAELVMEKTGQQLIYVGQGSGSTLAYIYASLKPEEAKTTMKGIISLGHLAYLDGMKSYIRFMLPVVDYLKPIINQNFHGEVPLEYGDLSCSSLLDYYLYEIKKVPLFGDDFSEIDPDYLPLLRTQNIQKTIGINVLLHFYQIMKSKKFQAFDYGAAGNQQKYAQPTPPEYNISAIPVPVTLFVGNNDWIASSTNAQRFYIQLDEEVQCGLNVVPCDKWNHNDFLEAKDIDKFLYTSLFKVIDDIGKGVCLKNV